MKKIDKVKIEKLIDEGYKIDFSYEWHTCDERYSIVGIKIYATEPDDPEMYKYLREKYLEQRNR